MKAKAISTPEPSGGRLLVGLDLRDKRVVVVGGGRVASDKISDLRRAGAVVTVIAPELGAETQRQHAEAVTWEPRPYCAGDLDGAWFAVAATDRPEVNQAVAAEAVEQRIFCTVISSAAESSAHLLAQIERGPVRIGISTGGASPFVARRLREAVEAAMPPETGALVALLGRLRPVVKARLADEAERRAYYEEIWLGPVPGLLAEGWVAEAEAWAEELLETLATP